MTNLDRPPQTLPPIVLLVEDDADTRDMYHTALECGGCWVVDAPNGIDALADAVELQPDVILTDVGLPGIRDGLGLARTLRQNPKTADIPVLAVTGCDPRTFGDDAWLFDEVYLKPVSPDVLVARIRETFVQSRLLHRRRAPAHARLAELLSASERIGHKSQVHERRQGSAFAHLCPRCGETLEWVERRQLSGVTFDYFQPCVEGCGRFCYNHHDKVLVSLTSD